MSNNQGQLVVPTSVIVKQILAATAESRAEVLDIVQNTWTFRAPVMHSAGSSAMVLYSRQVAEPFISRDAEVESPFEQLLYSMSKELFDHCYTNAWEEVPNFKSIHSEHYFINEYDFEIKAKSDADLDRFVHCTETLWLMSQRLSGRDQSSYRDWLGLSWTMSFYWNTLALADGIYDKKLDLYTFYRSLGRLSLMSKEYEFDMDDMVESHGEDVARLLAFIDSFRGERAQLSNKEVAKKIKEEKPWFGSYHALEDMEPGFWSKTIRQEYPPFATYNGVITFSYILEKLGLLSKDDVNYLLSNFKQ
jgi:hypothetical protein